jgi:ABC-type multidrug transport system fused ATPase/permease subunit
MGKAQPSVVKRSLFSWVFANNAKYQILLVVIIMVTVFARVLPLEMQKRIVNQAISLRKIDLLLRYCGIYIVAVVTASGLKFLINILQTLIAQRATAEMRKDLYHHLLTLPLNFFRKTQQGTIVNALSSELALPGNFVGMAVAVPVSNILTLIAFAVYLFWLNSLLAAVSLSIYPAVVFLIPLLQKRVNRANKQRIDKARVMSSKVAESVSGIHEIQSNGSFGIENRKFDRIVEQLYKIRVRWSLFRFGIKSTNNFFVSLGPFLIFILGGYLAIKGQLALGSLVAFLSAQEKLYDPWKELIEFYQVYQDGTVSYQRTMKLFDIEPEHVLEPEGRDPYTFKGAIEVKNLSFATETGIRLLRDVTFSLKPGEHLAVVGFSGSGKSTLAQCIGQLYKYSGGNLLIDGHEVSQLTKRDIVNNIGFVAQSPFIFTGTIEENLLYSSAARFDGRGEINSSLLPDRDDRIEVLQQTGIFVDVLRFGLNTILARDENPELVEQIIRVRHNLQENFGDELSEYVEFYHPDRYLYYSSIADNLLFGTPNQEDLQEENLPRNQYFFEFLKRADLAMPLMGLGAELCRQIVDILGNLPPDEIFFEQSPISPEEIETYKVLTTRLQQTRLHRLSQEDQEQLLGLALRFMPGKHKMVGLPQLLRELIMEGRSLFRETIQKDLPDAITFYQTSEYIHSQTILNNIFFGRMKTATSHAQEKINQSIIQVLIGEDMLETIIEIGMQFHVGSSGDRLSGGQRQKLAVARIFLKAPPVLIMDEATSALDNKSQFRIQNLLDTRWKGRNTLISVIHRLDTIKKYDKIIVLKAGKIGEMGTYDELMEKRGMLYELTGGKR